MRKSLADRLTTLLRSRGSVVYHTVECRLYFFPSGPEVEPLVEIGTASSILRVPLSAHRILSKSGTEWWEIREIEL